MLQKIINRLSEMLFLVSVGVGLGYAWRVVQTGGLF